MLTAEKCRRTSSSWKYRANDGPTVSCGGSGAVSPDPTAAGLVRAVCAFVVVAVVDSLGDFLMREAATIANAAGLDAIEVRGGILGSALVIVAACKCGAAEGCRSDEGGCNGGGERLGHFHILDDEANTQSLRPDAWAPGS